MEVKKRTKIITDWINNYCDTTSFSPKALVVGNFRWYRLICS